MTGGAAMTHDVGGPIRWRMHIPAPPERVFDLLTSAAAEGR